MNNYDPGQSKYLQSSLDYEWRTCSVAEMTALAYKRMVKKKKEDLLQKRRRLLSATKSVVIAFKKATKEAITLY